jgi:hypothetical protein
VTGRVLWILWCCLWAGTWATITALSWPHQQCLMTQLINPSGCLEWGRAGSWPLTAGLAAGAVLSLALIAVPVGKPEAGILP